MHDVPFIAWLDENGADELTKFMMMALLGALHFMPPEETKKISVLGGWGTLRTWVSGEAILVTTQPDAQEGLCIPLANEIERRGGAVWRRKKVERILVEGDAAR